MIRYLGIDGIANTFILHRCICFGSMLAYNNGISRSIRKIQSMVEQVNSSMCANVCFIINYAFKINFK